MTSPNIGERLAARMIDVPLLHSPLAALLAEKMGFDAVLLGGGSTAMNVYGLRDGLLSPGEVIEQVRRIRAVTELPIIADIDDAGGTPPHVQRYVRMAEDAGASALLVEDMDCANRFEWSEASGRWTKDQRRLRSIGAAADNIRVAVASRRNPETLVIARTDAIASAGIEDALERSHAYVEGGADAVFIQELPPERVGEAARDLGVPIMNLVPGVPSHAEHEALIESGLGIALYLDACGDLYATIVSAMRQVQAGIRGVPVDEVGPQPATLVGFVDGRGWTAEVVAEIRESASVERFVRPGPNH